MIIIPRRFSTTVSEMLRFSSLVRHYTADTWWFTNRALLVKAPSPQRVIQLFTILGEMARTIKAPPPVPFRSAIVAAWLSPYSGEEIAFHNELFGVTRDQLIDYAESSGCTVQKIRRNRCTLSIAAPDIVAFAHTGYLIGTGTTHPCVFDRQSIGEILAEVRSMPQNKYITNQFTV